jgi:hypothetical protein
MMRLRPIEAGFERHLATFLCRHDCRALVDEDGTVLVEPPHGLHENQAHLELELYVRLWQALQGISVRVEA